MSAYKPVPEYWFLILLVLSIVLSLLMCFVWKEEVQLPWWGLLFAFALAWIVTLPIGVIQATTNQVSIICRLLLHDVNCNSLLIEFQPYYYAFCNGLKLMDVYLH